jgi:hypothetical protein
VSVAGCRALVELRVAGAATTTVDAAGAMELQELRADSRVLRRVDVTNCGKLRHLLLPGRQPLQLLWTGCPALPQATVEHLSERARVGKQT